MTRTAEQITADDALTAAIEACRVAYWPDTAGRLITDYVIAFADTTFDDDDGDPDTVTASLVRDNNVPTYRVRGLLIETLDHYRPRPG